MKYAVMATLEIDTPAKSDKLAQEVLGFIGSKWVWGETRVNKGLTEEGKPQVSLEVRFQSRDNANKLFTLIKDRIVQIPVLSGRISKHVCYHDEQGNRPCDPAWEEFSA